MEALESMISNAGEDPKIGITRVIDEPSRTGTKFTIYEDGIGEGSVTIGVSLELVKLEEVNILLLGNIGLLATALGFLSGDDLSNIFIDELTLPDVGFRADAYVDMLAS